MGVREKERDRRRGREFSESIRFYFSNNSSQSKQADTAKKFLFDWLEVIHSLQLATDPLRKNVIVRVIPPSQ